MAILTILSLLFLLLLLLLPSLLFPSSSCRHQVNINKAKKEAFKILRPELEADDEESPFFDPRMRSERMRLARPKRSSFQFVEEGTFARQAEAMRIRVRRGVGRGKGGEGGVGEGDEERGAGRAPSAAGPAVPSDQLTG